MLQYTCWISCSYFKRTKRHHVPHPSLAISMSLPQASHTGILVQSRSNADGQQWMIHSSLTSSFAQVELPSLRSCFHHTMLNSLSASSTQSTPRTMIHSRKNVWCICCSSGIRMGGKRGSRPIAVCRHSSQHSRTRIGTLIQASMLQ